MQSVDFVRVSIGEDDETVSRSLSLDNYASYKNGSVWAIGVARRFVQRSATCVDNSGVASVEGLLQST